MTTPMPMRQPPRSCQLCAPEGAVCAPPSPETAGSWPRGDWHPSRAALFLYSASGLTAVYYSISWLTTFPKDNAIDDVIYRLVLRSIK